MSNLFAHTLLTAYHRVKLSLQHGLGIIRSNGRPFLIIQAGYWAIYGLGTALALRHPSLKHSALAQVDQQLKEYKAGRAVVAAYESGNVPLAALYTFGINLAIGAFGTIRLPSCVIPFGGIALAAYRAGTWGVIFAPIGKDTLTRPHFVTMLIEGQAYIIAALGGWIQGRGFNGWTGYKRGWKQALWLYAPITAVVLVAAIWEAVEVIHITGMVV